VAALLIRRGLKKGGKLVEAFMKGISISIFKSKSLRACAGVLFLLAGSAAAFGQAKPLTITHGNVAMGAYGTVAEFKNLKVEIDGKTVLEKTLGEGMDGIEIGAGTWAVEDGVLRQSSTDKKGMDVFLGDKSSTDLTVTVQARRIKGDEGFSLGFRCQDAQNFMCLNVGGWTNSRTQFGIRVLNNFSPIGDSTPMKVDDDKWYDVKVVVEGDHATGFVDGKQVASAKLEAPAATNNPPRGGQPPAGGQPPRGGQPPVAGGGNPGGAGSRNPTGGARPGGTSQPNPAPSVAVAPSATITPDPVVKTGLANPVAIGAAVGLRVCAGILATMYLRGRVR